MLGSRASDYKGKEEADRLAAVGSDHMTLCTSEYAKPLFSYIERRIEEQLFQGMYEELEHFGRVHQI